jgi:hypothetical protein
VPLPFAGPVNPIPYGRLVRRGSESVIQHEASVKPSSTHLHRHGYPLRSGSLEEIHKGKVIADDEEDQMAGIAVEDR